MNQVQDVVSGSIASLLQSLNFAESQFPTSPFKKSVLINTVKY